MAQDREKLMLFKARNRDLEIELADHKQQLQDLQKFEELVDLKLQGLQKINNTKIRSLMNSVQILKKSNKQLEDQLNETTRAKLINDLKKDIIEQEVVISVLRQFVLQDKEQAVDEEIVKNFLKGPPRVRELSREELKIEQKKIIITLQQAQQSSQLKKSQLDKSNTKKKKEEEEKKMDQSMVSNASTQANQEQANQLMLQLEEIKLGNDDLKLNLKAYEEILDRMEQDKEVKIQEVNGARKYVEDLEVLKQEYSIKQEEYEQLLTNNNQQYIQTYDKELRIQELEIKIRQQETKLKRQEEHLRAELEIKERLHVDMQTRKGDLQKDNSSYVKQNEEAQASLGKLQSDQQGSKYQRDQLDKEVKDLEKTIFNMQNDSDELLKNLDAKFSEFEKRIFQDALAIDQKNKKLRQLDDEYESLKGQKDQESNQQQSWMGMGQGQLSQENKELRERQKKLTKREIELQDQLEQLDQEFKFKLQQEKAENYLNKKQVSNTLKEEELKRQYQKEIQARYEGKITQLMLKVKELQTRNKSLENVFNEIENVGNKGDFDVSSGSDLSVSLTQIHKLDQQDKLSQVTDFDELKKQLVENDNQDLQVRVAQTMAKEIELHGKINELEQKIKKQGDKQMKKGEIQADPIWDKKIKDMKREYDKIVREMSKKISELENEEINLDSNIGSIMAKSEQFDDKDMQMIDSNVSLEQNDDLQFNLSQVSSNLGNIINAADKKDINRDDLKSVSSGISKILEKQKKK